VTSPPTRAGIRGRITKITRTYYEVTDNNNWLYEVGKDQVKEDDQSTTDDSDRRQLTERHKYILRKSGIYPPQR